MNHTNWKWTWSDKRLSEKKTDDKAKKKHSNIENNQINIHMVDSN